MLIALYNLEPKYSNLALEKCRMYHKLKGDTVQDYIPLYDNQYDLIYCSSIFTATKKPWAYMDKRWIYGGTGFNLTTVLPDEIDSMKPKLNFGFTMRGCPNKCEFCAVPQKEGPPRPTGDIYDLWDGKSKSVKLYDNNIFALPEHFRLIASQIKKENLKVDWNQGLDARLLSDEFASILAGLRHDDYRFAMDHYGMERIVEDTCKLMASYGMKRNTWMVLVGMNTTLQQDYDRLEFLKSLSQNACVMRYRKITDDMPESKCDGENKHIYSQMARWANQHHMFQAMSFEQFDKLK